MPETEITRLTITWSKDTDLALRSYLGACSIKPSTRCAKPSPTCPPTSYKT